MSQAPIIFIILQIILDNMPILAYNISIKRQEKGETYGRHDKRTVQNFLKNGYPNHRR